MAQLGGTSNDVGIGRIVYVTPAQDCHLLRCITSFATTGQRPTTLAQRTRAQGGERGRLGDNLHLRAGMSRPFTPYPFTPLRHPTRLPLLSGNRDTRRHPVVIVGAGPVGYTVALGLAAHGVRSVLIEADDSVCVGSRAICISRRSLQIFDRLGVLDGFLKIGLPWTGGRSFYREEQVLHFTMPHDENQKLPPMVNLAQYHIEQILLDRAEALADLIDIRWQTRVTGLDARPDGATLTVETPDGAYSLDADWVVAADGGRSFVRESLGLPLNGTTYEGRYVIVDILLESARPTERLAYFDPPCNRGSTVLVHKQPDNVWRVDYQLKDGEDPDEAIKPENVIPRVASLLEMMGERGAWSPIWIAMYRAHALTLDRYRHGRFLFAGDAAHLLPIFGVRGANSGIDDADNLAWKLAFVAKGIADDGLLDSYSDERVAAARENLAQGTKSTEFMAPPSFAFSLMREAVLGLATRHAGVRSLINPRQTSAITYGASPLNVHDSARAFRAGPVPGAVLAECPVMIGGSETPRAGYLTEVLGAHFTVLVFGVDDTICRTVAESVASMDALGIPIRAVSVVQASDAAPSGNVVLDHTGRLFPMYDARPGAVYLVRPDGHVLGRWHGLSAMDLRNAIGSTLK